MFHSPIPGHSITVSLETNPFKFYKVRLRDWFVGSSKGGLYSTLEVKDINYSCLL